MDLICKGREVGTTSVRCWVVVAHRHSNIERHGSEITEAQLEGPRYKSHQGNLHPETMLNGYNFTTHVRSVLELAREESVLHRHEYIGTEHLLLGLLRQDEGVAGAVFHNLGTNLSEVRTTIDSIVKSGKPDVVLPPTLPFTSRAKKVLELSFVSARELNHDHVGTEHLLLGLLKEEKGIGAQVLMQCGLTEQSVRAEVIRLTPGSGFEAIDLDGCGSSTQTGKHQMADDAIGRFAELMQELLSINEEWAKTPPAQRTREVEDRIAARMQELAERMRDRPH